MRMHGIFAASLLTCFCQASYGQALVQAEAAVLQPQILRDGNGFVSCGLRAMASIAKRGWVEAHDFSVLVDGQALIGLFKAGKKKTSLANALKGNYTNDTVMPAPIKFWVAKETDGKALIPDKVMKSDTPGYIMGPLDFSKSFDVIMGMMAGERMQFAIRYKDEPLDTVISFAAALPESEAAALDACLAGLVGRLQQELDKLGQDK